MMRSVVLTWRMKMKTETMGNSAMHHATLRETARMTHKLSNTILVPGNQPSTPPKSDSENTLFLLIPFLLGKVMRICMWQLRYLQK